MNISLCCQINPRVRCEKCSAQLCDEHNIETMSDTSLISQGILKEGCSKQSWNDQISVVHMWVGVGRR